jgi:hypothetical protein
MRLNYRQRCQLRLIKAGMRRSDPLLCAMFGMFGRLYRGEEMPAWEQVPTSRGRGRIAARGLALFAAMAAVFSTVLTAAHVAVIAMRHPRRRPGPSAHGGRRVTTRARLGTASRSVRLGHRTGLALRRRG